MKRYEKVTWALSLILVGVISFGLSVTNPVQGIVPDDSSVQHSPVLYSVASNTLATIPVSGLVQAADTAIISTQTNGILNSLLVTEGSIVQSGQLVAKQATPVADSRVANMAAIKNVREAEQAVLLADTINASKQALVTARTATTVASLRSEANIDRTKEEATAVRTSIENSITVLLDALAFVQENQQFFDDQKRKQFDTIVSQLYGRVPNHFQGSVRYGTSERGEIMKQLESLRLSSLSSSSVIELQILAVVLNEQLQATTNLFVTAEQDILDTDLVMVGEDVYETYFMQRKAITKALSQLELSQAALERMIDSIEVQTTEDAGRVIVTALDRELSELQVTLANDLKSAVIQAANTAQLVTEAEKNLAYTRAPFSGEVAEIFVNVGEFATEGKPLLRLVGVESREIEVTVPTSIIGYISTNTKLVVEGKTVGYVDRWSSVSQGMSHRVFVSLTSPEVTVGSSLSGELQFEANNNLGVIPRSYIRFTANGPVAMTNDGEVIPISVLIDNGESLVIKSLKLLYATKLVPEASIQVGSY
jgi:multidrug efflux pump subunit AcrA (membrane-fusion protein)